MMPDADYDGEYREPRRCYYCDGNGWRPIGHGGDCTRDESEGTYSGEVEMCPYCHGSGLARD